MLKLLPGQARLTTICFSQRPDPDLVKLASFALSCPTHIADCERAFSVQNYILTERWASLSPTTCDQLMRICISGPSFTDMPFIEAVERWDSKSNRKLFAH
ncbi:MAG: hypothetical protein DSZ28_08500 [Thiothrix sp.]|nr:MAG: hypothetical protein DSZ28_08500 [Thiothrix sp.]